jgi:NADP-dependent 3-hydroxy acid dehydrogenase YdfG
VSPGFVQTDFTDAVPDVDARERMQAVRDAMAIPPEAIGEAIAFAIGQPPNVEVGDIVVRPTAQN